MNNIIIKYFLICVFGILCQILITEYLNIWYLLYIIIFTPVIISMSPTINKTLFMIIAFLSGLCIDIFADGVFGLNAASLLALAYSRSFILKLPLFKLNLDNVEKNMPITAENIGLFSFTILSLLLNIVFFIVYIFLDSSTFFSLEYLLLKFIICIIINATISVLINISLLQKILK